MPCCYYTTHLCTWLGSMATPLPATSMPCLSLLVPEVSLLTTIPVDSFGYHNLRGVMRPLVMDTYTHTSTTCLMVSTNMMALSVLMVDIIIAERTLTVLGVVTHATTLYVWWCWFLLLPILSVHSSLIQWIRLLFSVLIMMSLP